MQEKKYNFVYQTKNMVNGKTYIGVRTCNNLNDGYIGCGVINQNSAIKAVGRDSKSGYKHSFKSAVVKYGYENFKREILCFFDTAQEAYDEESYLVDEKWVKSSNNYNISLGGKGGHMGFGKSNQKYRGDIHIFDKVTKEFVGTYESASQIKQKLGFNQAAISRTLRLETSGYKRYFFTRDKNNWEKELKKVQDKIAFNIKNKKANVRPINAYNLDGTLYKTFPSKIEACRFFKKSKNGICYLNDIADKIRKDGSPYIGWGYFWRHADNIKPIPFKKYEREPTIHQICLKSSKHIDSYLSGAEASQKTGLNASRITGILSGKYLKTENYYFTKNLKDWEKEFSEAKTKLTKLKNKPSSCVKVECYTIKGETVKKFDSLLDAGKFAKEENYKTATVDILKACDKIGKSGKPRTAYGYIWKRV